MFVSGNYYVISEVLECDGKQVFRIRIRFTRIQTQPFSLLCLKFSIFFIAIKKLRIGKNGILVLMPKRTILYIYSLCIMCICRGEH